MDVRSIFPGATAGANGFRRRASTGRRRIGHPGLSRILSGRDYGWPGSQAGLSLHGSSQTLMRVVHLNTDDSRGGATRSALRLHRALLARGTASEFLVRPGTPAAPYVEWVQEDYLNRRRTGRSPAILSFTFPGVSVVNEARVQAADVLNLHWVAGFLGTDQIGELLGLDKPVVWTLHDQWPMTGGCHYTSGCEQFTDHCRQCPQLQEDEAGLSGASFGDRLETWDSRIVAVCP